MLQSLSPAALSPISLGYKAIQVKGDKYVVTNKIALDKTSTRIRRGYTDTLKAIVEANGKTYEVADPITWASDKEAVATVENGVVTGVDYGSATITATLGGQVAWNEAAKEVTLTVNGKEIKMTIGKALEKYGVAPVIIGGRTFVPVRFVADELGAVTTWDDATKTVTIQAVK